jgi:hypothetical protein
MTYSASLSSNSDKVRFLLGDTSNSAATELLADGEVTWLLTEETNVYRAAAVGAEAIAAKFSRLADTSVGDVSVQNSQKSKQYLELAKRLYTSATGKGTGAAFLGGYSISDRDTRLDDTDRVLPFFDRQHPGGDDRIIIDRTESYVRNG